MKTRVLLGCSLLLVLACGKRVDSETTKAPAAAAATHFAREIHLANIKQLTFGGQNAEAYFSSDGRELIFQSTREDHECDAIYRMTVEGEKVVRLSSGKGVTTCSYISPDGQTIIYASTHEAHDICPPRPDMSRGYVWPVRAEYDIYAADPDGSNLRKLTDSPGYDAECVYSVKGDKILFTSVRSGDLELFMMNPDGSAVEQLTDLPGYDGGGFFSPDGSMICWRASRPTGAALEEYQALLKDGLVRPTQLEIYVMSLADRKPIQVTSNNAGNFGPYFHPDGKRVIFASNMLDPRGRNFELFLVNIETRALTQITDNPTFDGFPMFSPDGKKLVFASNRDGKVRGETNIFIADWVEEPSLTTK